MICGIWGALVFCRFKAILHCACSTLIFSNSMATITALYNFDTGGRPYFAPSKLIEMKKRKWLMAGICILMSLSISCKKETTGITTEIPKAEVTATGKELEAPQKAIIGADGGKLMSKDGLLEIIIPEGALSAETEIGVSAIENTSGSSTGLSYRITPHIRFAKPATLAFSYANHEDSIGLLAATGISYRDEQGVWQLKRRSTLDETNKKVSVQTDHFSDWALTSVLKVSPRYSTLKRLKSVKITPYASVPLETFEDLDNLFSASGPDVTIPLLIPYVLPSDFIVDFFITGSGELTPQQDGSSILYTASDENDPLINPVIVNFVLTGAASTLKARVKIIPDREGVFITMNNKTYEYTDAFATFSNGYIDVQFSKQTGGQTFSGSLGWRNNTTGEAIWNEDNLFNWEPEGFSPKRMFLSYYNDGMNISAGHIKTIAADAVEVGGMLEGNFIINNSGAINTESGNGEYLGDSRITGRFLVKRTY